MIILYAGHWTVWIDVYKRQYFMWPAPTLNLCYFPNGENYSTGTPIVEAIQLWDPGWTVDPDNPSAYPPMTLKPYTAANGAKITITVKESVVTTCLLYTSRCV